MGGWFKREGIYVYIWLVHNVGKQKLAQQCKAIIQSLNHVPLFVTPWTAAYQTSLSIINSLSSPKLMSIESVMSSNHLILCHPLVLLPSIFPSIRVFSNELVLGIRWPKYWSFSLSISPSTGFPLQKTVANHFSILALRTL